MLSGDGDHPMTKLSDTQAVILSTASQRDDRAVLPLPETLKLTGGALTKVLGSLEAKGLIEHQGTPRGDDRRRCASPAPACRHRRRRGHRQHAVPGHGRATGRP